MQANLREAEADKKTAERQHEAAVRDVERVQTMASDLSAARVAAEQTVLTQTTEVSRLQYANARLEQEGVNKDQVWYGGEAIIISIMCHYNW